MKLIESEPASPAYHLILETSLFYYGLLVWWLHGLCVADGSGETTGAGGAVRGAPGERGEAALAAPGGRGAGAAAAVRVRARGATGSLTVTSHAAYYATDSATLPYTDVCANIDKYLLPRALLNRRHVAPRGRCL